MHMTQFGYRRRISNESSEPTITDEIGTKVKLGDLVKRARDFGKARGPLKPIEALMTVDQNEWTWQVVDRDVLDKLSHRLVFQSDAGMRREILMTEGLETAMGAASMIVELDGGCVLIETLEP
ncbi:MAG TPA: hypothetical protein EYQ11_02670 [Candidatus Poseidoniales archaeon]|nr:MAG: hypothetical protein CXT66_02255 [Euryarchaeota archaeon]HIG33770.1 hypothetical protein [Candidatus Poseidoniales archaeon]HIL67656.1 hypothetical protein [Candidatus Poseidoniales archaeon]